MTDASRSGPSAARGIGAPAPSGAASRLAAKPTARGAYRRGIIVSAAAKLFAHRGYAAVGINDIGAAAGVTGPAIYRHFESKAAVLAAVIDGIIDAVSSEQAVFDDPAAELTTRVERYAAGVAARRALMTVFVREVHHLPDEYREGLRHRQRSLIARWCALVSAIHPDWGEERVRTSVHAVFGMLNAVGTFTSPLTDGELAEQMVILACTALQIKSPAEITSPAHSARYRCRS